MARSPEAVAAAAAARQLMVSATAAERVRQGVSIDNMSDGSITFRFSDGAGGGREAGSDVEEGEGTDAAAPSPWKVLAAIECFRLLNGEGKFPGSVPAGVGLVDIRPAGLSIRSLSSFIWAPSWDSTNWSREKTAQVTLEKGTIVSPWCSTREHRREAIKGAVSAPAAALVGRALTVCS